MLFFCTLRSELNQKKKIMSRIKVKIGIKQKKTKKRILCFVRSTFFLSAYEHK